MSHMVVDLNLCQKDGACVAVCPSGAIQLNRDGFPTEFSEGECILCGHCMAVCATEALSHPGMPREGFEPLPNSMPTSAQMDGLLVSRRSIRAFKKRPVNRETILTCLDIARHAPSAKNAQVLNWIVIDGANKVRELAREMILGLEPVSMRLSELEQWQNAKDGMLRGAPMVVVACAPTNYTWGKEDAAIALAYFEMAARTRGLSACWAGYLTHIAGNHAPLQQLLNVPDGYTVRGAMMVGESKYSYRRVPPRKPLSLQWC
jgi:nitroreductase/NAD-dependent dihydropyrimidine dehydrogenase PreA subunit